MKNLYLAYGSNLNLKQMGYRCPDAVIRGSTILKDYQLYFRGNRHSGVATIEAKRGSLVPVLLWEITEACEQALDRYEGYPHLYRKEKLKVHLDTVEVDVMAYIMNECYPYALPGMRYYTTILEGYHDCGFRKEVLNKAVIATRKAIGG